MTKRNAYKFVGRLKRGTDERYGWLLPATYFQVKKRLNERIWHNQSKFTFDICD